jgi:hypothetical protein
MVNNLFCAAFLIIYLPKSDSLYQFSLNTTPFFLHIFFMFNVDAAYTI